jgi:small-conductance mechanosensitive channel
MQAQRRLRRFRGSLLAVALTTWLLMLLGAPVVVGQEEPSAPQAVPAASEASEVPEASEAPSVARRRVDVDLGRSTEEATSTLRDLLMGFVGFLPQLVIGVAILLLAALVQAIVRPVLRRVLRSWTRANAIAALVGIVIWLAAISAALSVMVGDPRTLLGSVGLIGLALSWALQAPIESFTAWLLNSFRSYYRVGDRIGVGDVFGDVFRIDFLTTTVWEAGGPGKPVQGAQPTGALVTFPNSEVLRANVVNYTRDFPYVWDELDVSVTNQSDLVYLGDVLNRVAHEVVGAQMAEPIQRYRSMLQRAALDLDVSEEPQIYFSQTDTWTNATIRYLADARRRRKAASDLILALSRELARDEHRGRFEGAAPRMQVRLLPPDGEAQPGAV